MTTAEILTQPRIEIAPVPAFKPLYDYAYDSNIRSFFMWGGRGGAKSTAMADFFASYGRIDRGNFLCTREIQQSLADSVFGAIRESIQTNAIPGYHITERGLAHRNGCRFIFAGLGFRGGVHVKSTTNVRRCWVEEAQQVSSGSLEVLIPTVRQPGSQMYYTFNRTLPRDPIFDLFNSYNTKCEKIKWRFNGHALQWKLHRGDGVIGIEINYDGNPFFPDVLEAERLHAEETAKSTGYWGSYNHVWRGLPQDASESSILTLEQVTNAARRQIDDEGAVEVGADIARGGRDRVVFVKRKGLKVTAKRVYANNAESEKMRITETAERLMAFTGSKENLIKVDDTGLGGGVTDILEDNGYNVVGINFGAKAADYDHYTNCIAEMWFNFTDIIDEISIPDENGLIEELVGRREGRRDNRGRRTVEPKDDFIKRIGRSPDEADALLLCFYEPGTVITSMPWKLV